jgi:intraflagellar transport protein 140
MKEFQGVSGTDSLSIASIINFNYHLTNGSMEEAYKAIKHINSTEIWKNMAEMSVKMNRIDVAETCFSNMKFARGAKALREMEAQGADKEAKIASVALLLNMTDEAEKILSESKRFDQLNNLHQLKNEWDKAIRIAEHEDRINLKNTYYKAAKNYEQHKNFTEATKYYELSETHLEEVPRMLYESEQFPALLEYADKLQDKNVYSFVGKVYEKYDDFDEAKNFYTKGGDHASLVRLSLQRNEVEEAEVICNNSGDAMACYILGRYLEDKNEIPRAIAIYKKGKHFMQSIKIALSGGDDDEVYACASQAPFYVQTKIAPHFEKKGFSEKAVILYMKGRNYKKALKLAMSNNLTEYVQQITSLMDKEKADPDSLKNLGDMYVDQGNVDRAFSMYVGSGQIDKAIEILENNNITLSSDAVKKLIPPKGQTEAENQKRDKIITIIAKRLKQQGKYLPAAKLYTEVNLPIKALKAVILSGDAEKVVQMANLARSAEGYVLAANFLQNSDWQNNPEIIKNITAFYTKAKKWDALANFYVNCAMLEIDEYKNYDKALTALDVAKKSAEKGADDSRAIAIEERMRLIQSFIEGRNMLRSSPEDGIQRIREVIRDRNSRDYLR